MTTNGNGTVKPLISPEEIMALVARQGMAINSLRTERYASAGYGETFSGNRDIYAELGYKKYDPTVHDHLFRFKRQNIAKKIVTFPASETWKKPPVIIDDNGRSDEEKPASPFVQTIKTLITKRRFWHYLERADRVAGIGRYGLLLLGLKDGQDLNILLAKNSVIGLEGLLYFSIFGEMSVMNNLDSSLDTNPQSERYGLPFAYHLRMGQNMPSKVVHHSRLIHVAEELLEDEIYSAPRLEIVDTLLDDLLKIIGGSSEANWFNAHPGLHFDIRDDASMGTADEAAYADEIDDYVHKLNRVIRTKNIDSKMFAPNLVDPTGNFKAVISLISGATDIPQRILIGSERGELASSQDAANWAGTIASRQVSFAEPVILRPVIDRLVFAGVLPEPKGEYRIEWPPIFEMDDTQKAALAKTVSETLEKVTAPQVAKAVDLPKFTEHYLPKLKDAVSQPEEPEPVVMPPVAPENEPPVAGQPEIDGADSGAEKLPP